MVIPAQGQCVQRTTEVHGPTTSNPSDKVDPHINAQTGEAEEDNQEHTTGKTRRRRKWNKRRNKKTQLQNLMQEQAAEVRTPVNPGLQAHQTSVENITQLHTNANSLKPEKIVDDRRAQPQSNEHIEPEAPKVPSKRHNKGTKNRKGSGKTESNFRTQPTEPSTPDTPHDAAQGYQSMGVQDDAQKENAPSRIINAANNRVDSDKASMHALPTTQKQKKRKNRAKGQRKGKHADEAVLQAPPPSSGPTSVSDAKCSRESSVRASNESNSTEYENTAPFAGTWNSKGDLGKSCFSVPSKSTSPELGSNSPVLQNKAHGTKGGQPLPTAFALEERNKLEEVDGPKMTSATSFNESGEQKTSTGANVSAMNINKKSRSNAQSASKMFSPPRTQERNYTSSQDVRNDFDGASPIRKKKWSARRGQFKR